MDKQSTMPEFICADCSYYCELKTDVKPTFCVVSGVECIWKKQERDDYGSPRSG